MFMGYLNEEEKTKESFESNGYVRSGDIGRIDESGFLYITGRIKGFESINVCFVANQMKQKLTPRISGPINQILK